jgi:hypothetical protein
MPGGYFSGANFLERRLGKVRRSFIVGDAELGIRYVGFTYEGALA